MKNGIQVAGLGDFKGVGLAIALLPYLQKQELKEPLGKATWSGEPSLGGAVPGLTRQAKLPGRGNYFFEVIDFETTSLSYRKKFGRGLFYFFPLFNGRPALNNRILPFCLA